jgi:chromosomal replication initiator protein
LAYHDLWGKPLNEATAAEALADLLPRRRKIVADKVLEAVAQAYGVSVAELRAKGRSRRVAVPRQVAMYLLREEAGLSLPRIGELLGGRDHSTIMHGTRKVADLLERDAHFRRRVMNIREHLYNPHVPLVSE